MSCEFDFDEHGCVPPGYSRHLFARHLLAIPSLSTTIRTKRFSSCAINHHNLPSGLRLNSVKQNPPCAWERCWMLSLDGVSKYFP
ncbi:hypothetical protein NPIL_569901 [Nephila pilipes]|uniref:Uncharacterized protein n=1 Tax=Nephila pilipes TaxID=299642 RepID=A0A8X6PZV9_NEPPI|nr:hypothetical protein NPIL_569901 [Nephila pilipes]